MPAINFICPDGVQWSIADCLRYCRMQQRCMFTPMLRAIAVSANRKLDGFSVTELISGTRETYLKRKHNYAIEPASQVYAMHGTAFHSVNEEHSAGFTAEQRLFGKYCSGCPDIYGELVSPGIITLGDLKVTSSYKIMKALGLYKKDMPTGEVYKTGAKKGQVKTRKELFSGGVRHLLEWALQVNMYRLLLEAEGKRVDDMFIQAICRDFGLQVASQRGITSEVAMIPIHKISDVWLDKYFKTKSQRLEQALQLDELPPPCRPRENWHGRKCNKYCNVSEHCDYIAARGGIKEITEIEEDI